IIATQVDRAEDAGDGTFYYAQDYHQAYLHKNPAGYCNHGFCQVAY
ncbi:MAG TPA: peptide-methionine (S)-S-oxide reductase, partial [Demequinaceae bacterium]